MGTSLRPHTPTERDILQRIQRKTGERVLSADTILSDISAMKNIDYIEVVMELESAYRVEIPDNIAWSVATPAELARYVDRKARGDLPL